MKYDTGICTWTAKVIDRIPRGGIVDIFLLAELCSESDEEYARQKKQDAERLEAMIRSHPCSAVVDDAIVGDITSIVQGIPDLLRREEVAADRLSITCMLLLMILIAAEVVDGYGLVVDGGGVVFASKYDIPRRLALVVEDVAVIRQLCGDASDNARLYREVSELLALL